MGFHLSVAFRRTEYGAADGKRRAQGADAATHAALGSEVAARASRRHPEAIGGAPEGVQARTAFHAPIAGGTELDAPPLHGDLRLARLRRFCRADADGRRAFAIARHRVCRRRRTSLLGIVVLEETPRGEIPRSVSRCRRRDRARHQGRSAVARQPQADRDGSGRAGAQRIPQHHRDADDRHSDRRGLPEAV